MLLQLLLLALFRWFPEGPLAHGNPDPYPEEPLITRLAIAVTEWPYPSGFT